MTWNPFDWTAGPFLTFYVTSAMVVFLWGFRLRSTIGATARMSHELSALELAYLSGGPRRVGDAVLLGLVSAKSASIAAKGNKISVSNQAPLATLMSRPPILAVRSEMTRQQFQVAVKPIVERLRERLGQLGYSPTDDQMKSFRATVLPMVALLFVFGLIKVIVGAERDHPVGFLIILLVFTAVSGFALATSPSRTRAGKEALQNYKASNARASRAPLDHELVLAVALSGAVVLSGTAYSPVYAASKTMSGGDGGGSCGGGGCGGGGGGCGGCS